MNMCEAARKGWIISLAILSVIGTACAVSRTLAEGTGQPPPPFEQMPKLRVVFGDVRHEVFDQERKLPSNTVRLHRNAYQVTVRIPLKAMGDPQRALTSVHNYLGVDPLDWAEWRVVEWEGKPTL
jgi:hypothetical protein